MSNIHSSQGTKERKSVRAEVKQVSEAGEFEAVIATLGVVDHDGDIIAKGAFAGGGTVSVQPSHDAGALPLGKARIEERDDKAVAVGRLNLDTQSGREWHSHLKFDLANGDPIQEWSFGFMIEEAGEEIRDGREIRVLQKLDTFEVSPVLLGAGINTGTVAVKGMKLTDELERVVVRIEEVRSMRKDKGKDLGPERVAQLKLIHGKLDALLKEMGVTDDDESAEDDDPATEDQEGEMTPEEQALATDLARQVGLTADT